MAFFENLNFFLGYVDQAKEEGAEIFQIEVPEALKANKGLYYPPTLITHVNAASTVVMEEVFGPVAVALPFRYPTRTRAIITRSWFETTLDYKPRILGPHFIV